LFRNVYYCSLAKERSTARVNASPVENKFIHINIDIKNNFTQLRNKLVTAIFRLCIRSADSLLVRQLRKSSTYQWD